MWTVEAAGGRSRMAEAGRAGRVVQPRLAGRFATEDDLGGRDLPGEDPRERFEAEDPSRIPGYLEDRPDLVDPRPPLVVQEAGEVLAHRAGEIVGYRVAAGVAAVARPDLHLDHP